jgi:hypothetical protein
MMIMAEPLAPVPRNPYPVRVRGVLDGRPSRWLWLVKWLLIVPHVLVLVFLWTAFWLLSIVAMVAIVITGRYPRAIFDFNLGVMRWSWRVSYYSYGVLGTDRYPPFSLGAEPDYPATLDVEYPEQLSRGLALVKWWLLAIPHYLILGLLFSGVTLFVWRFDDTNWAMGGSIVGLLVLIAAIMLAFTGSYPRPLFDIIMAIQRWALRVVGYAGLMTDRYPPFRFDLGGEERDGPTEPATPEPAVPVRHAGP